VTAQVSQTEAQYTPRSPNLKTVCSKCRHFEDPDSCDKVRGSISNGGWCKYFSAKLLGARYGK